jgi:hypothetical protein
LVTSADSAPIAERGGRRRRLFAPTRDGRLALRAAHALRERVRDLGTETS